MWVIQFGQQLSPGSPYFVKEVPVGVDVLHGRDLALQLAGKKLSEIMKPGGLPISIPKLVWVDPVPLQ